MIFQYIIELRGPGRSGQTDKVAVVKYLHSFYHPVSLHSLHPNIL